MMMRLHIARTLRIVLLVSFATLATQSAMAQDITKEAATFVESLGARAVEVASDKDLTESARNRRFHDMFVEGFDVPAIGRFVLGRSWHGATEAERAEFLKLFEDMVVKSYARRFADYKGERFAVDSSRSDGADHAIVGMTVALPNADPVRVEWRVSRVTDPPGKLKIADVVVEGVSMSVTQQQEFGSLIQRNGGQIGPLLTAMRERIARQSEPKRN
jgi:phospholipid transport system substrate-binding protein